MNTQDWDDILTVMAIAVLADHRLRDPELVEFCHEAQRICRKFYPEHIAPRADLRDWFLAHQDDLTAKLKSDDAQSFMTSAVRRIEDTQIRPAVLQAIFSISICDYDLDDEETAYLNLCQEEWNIGITAPEIA